MKRPSPVCLLSLLSPSIPVVCFLGPALASTLVFLGFFLFIFFVLITKRKKGKKIINGTKP